MLSCVGIDTSQYAADMYLKKYYQVPKKELFLMVWINIEASRSHSDMPHSVRLLWMSDQPDAETST